jgi:hypothetical protein
LGHNAKDQYTNDKSLEITPTIAAHAGSQYFIKNITNLIVGNRDNGNGQDQQIGSTVVEIDEVNKFNILNIELVVYLLTTTINHLFFHLFLI